MASASIRQYQWRVAGGERRVGHTNMASHSVLLAVALLGLAMAPAVYSATYITEDGRAMNAKMGQGMRAKVAGAGGSLNANMGSGMIASLVGKGAGMKVSMGSGMNANLGAPGESLGDAVAKLFNVKGPAFFPRLYKVFPSTAKLRDVLREPANYTPRAVNKILAAFAAQLTKLVVQNAINKEQADLLLKQTVKELQVALKGKFEVDSIKLP